MNSDPFELPDTEESLAIFVLSGNVFFSFCSGIVYCNVLMHIHTNLWLIKEVRYCEWDHIMIVMSGTNELMSLTRNKYDKVLFDAIVLHWNLETE
jgi:hypothetical protein